MSESLLRDVRHLVLVGSMFWLVTWLVVFLFCCRTLFCFRLLLLFRLMNIDCHIKNSLCKKRIVCFQWLIIFFIFNYWNVWLCSAFVLAEWFVPDSFFSRGIYIYTVHLDLWGIHKLISFTYSSRMFNTKRFSDRISLMLNHFIPKYSLTLNKLSEI